MLKSLLPKWKNCQWQILVIVNYYYHYSLDETKKWECDSRETERETTVATIEKQNTEKQDKGQQSTDLSNINKIMKKCQAGDAIRQIQTRRGSQQNCEEDSCPFQPRNYVLLILCCPSIHKYSWTTDPDIIKIIAAATFYYIRFQKVWHQCSGL